MEKYNTSYHRVIKATPKEILDGEKENQVERKFVESELKQGDRVRV